MFYPLFLKKIKPLYCVILLYVVWVLSLMLRNPGGSDDFNVFFNAGQRLLNGENIYGEPYYMNLRYFYSPLFAGFLALFSHVNVEVVKMFWYLMNVTLLVRIMYIIGRYVNWNFKGHVWALVFLLLLTGKMVLANFLTSQISIFMLWAILESFYQCSKGRWLSSVIILCIGINIKILPVMIIPFYLLFTENKFRFATTSVAVTVLLLLIPALWTGWQYNSFLVQQWFTLISPVNPMHVVQVYEGGFLDLGMLVSKYFSAAPVMNEPSVNIASISNDSVFMLTNILRVIILLISVRVVSKMVSNPFKIDKAFVQLTPFVAMIPLLLPHQRDYSLLFFVPLLTVLIAFIVRLNKLFLYSLFAVLCIVSGMFAWLDLVGSNVVDIYINYRIITMGMLAILFFYLSLIHLYNKGYWTEF